MVRENGGELATDEDDWQRYPIPGIACIAIKPYIRGGRWGFRAQAALAVAAECARKPSY